MEDHLFASRQDWYRHELEAHRTTWQCISGCNTLFQHVHDYENHVSTTHPELASATVLAALKVTARKAGSATAQADCPFCTSSMTVQALKHHVGRHQEELALFALPSNLEEADGITEGDDDSINAATNEEDLAVEASSDLSDDKSSEHDERGSPVENRDQVYCHDCRHEWYGALNTLCPECGSTATETVRSSCLSRAKV